MRGPAQANSAATHVRWWYFREYENIQGFFIISPHTGERLAVFLFHVAASSFVEVEGGRASRGQTES